MPHQTVSKELKSGICPNCGGDTELDYDSPDFDMGGIFDGGKVYAYWECPKCGYTGTEVYSLTFHGFESTSPPAHPEDYEEED